MDTTPHLPVWEQQRDLLDSVRDLQDLRFARPADAGRFIARELGYTGRKGGWLYTPAGQRAAGEINRIKRIEDMEDGMMRHGQFCSQMILLQIS